MRKACPTPDSSCPLKKCFGDVLFVCRLVRASPKSFSLQGSLPVPTFPMPKMNQPVSLVINPAPFRKGISFTVNIYDNICRHIISLFYLSRPLTVFWVVVFITVNPINRVFGGRSISYIMHKVCISVFTKPSITNLDTSATVSMVSPKRRLIAPVSHGVVRTISRFTVHIATMLVSTIILTNRLAFVTAFTRVPIKARFIRAKNIATRTFYSIGFSLNFYYGQLTLIYHKYIITDGEIRCQ